MLLLSAALMLARLSVAAPAVPQAVPLLERFGFQREDVESRLAAPDVPPPGAQPPLIDAALWNRLPPPGAEALALATSRLPWVNAALVRELNPAEAEAVIGRAADRGFGLLDLFTDPGFAGGQIYLLTAATLQALSAKFELPTVCLIEGQDVHGRAFRIQAIVAGQGHVDMLYDRDGVEFRNPSFPDYPFIVREVVRQTIEAPGTLAVQGLSVNAGLFKPAIQKFVRLSTTKIRVQTSMGAREADAKPVRRK